MAQGWYTLLVFLKDFQFLTWQLCSKVSVALDQCQSHRAFYDGMNVVAISYQCHSWDRHLETLMTAISLALVLGSGICRGSYGQSMLSAGLFPWVAEGLV